MRGTDHRAKTNLWAANVLVTFFRAVFRIREATLPENKRARLRQLRLKLDAVNHDRDILLERLKSTEGWEKFEILDEFEKRHMDPQMWESRRPQRENVQKSRQESERLQAIRLEANGDWAVAAAGYRAYISGHADSHCGYSYLGGALKKSGDLEGSLSAYREALRLSGDRPVPSGSARISVATVLHALGQTEAALAELRGLVNTADSQNEAILCLAYDRFGDILLDTGDRKAARQAWKRSIKHDPTQTIANKAREKLSAAS